LAVNLRFVGVMVALVAAGIWLLLRRSDRAKVPLGSPS